MVKEKKDNKILIEKYKGVNVYYDVPAKVFVTCEPDICIENSNIWGIEYCIDKSKDELIDKVVYINYFFEKMMSKIHLISVNNVTGTSVFRILEDTVENKISDKITELSLIPIYYEVNEHNSKIFNAVKVIQDKIDLLQKEQGKLVYELK